MGIYPTFLIGNNGIAADELDGYPTVYIISNTFTITIF